jgi:hypothetical protein
VLCRRRLVLDDLVLYPGGRRPWNLGAKHLPDGHRVVFSSFVIYRSVRLVLGMLLRCAHILIHRRSIINVLSCRVQLYLLDFCEFMQSRTTSEFLVQASSRTRRFFLCTRKNPNHRHPITSLRQIYTFTWTLTCMVLQPFAVSLTLFNDF